MADEKKAEAKVRVGKVTVVLNGPEPVTLPASVVKEHEDGSVDLWIQDGAQKRLLRSVAVGEKGMPRFVEDKAPAKAPK